MVKIHFDICLHFCIFTFGALGLESPRKGAIQELSRGIVNIVNAQKITDITFPFPYAQFVQVMLMISAVLTPWIMSTLTQSVHRLN